MTPAEAREIDRLEFEAEATAIRQRAYALMQHTPVKPQPQPQAPKPVPKPAPKPVLAPKPRNPNGRPAKLYTFGDTSLPLSEWATRLNMTPSAIYQRINKGWTIGQIMATPAGKHRPKSMVH